MYKIKQQTFSYEGEPMPESLCRWFTSMNSHLVRFDTDGGHKFRTRELAQKTINKILAKMPYTPYPKFELVIVEI